jgi:NodT family efflux transporter outer membrane factor (OMF) lipoprotein
MKPFAPVMALALSACVSVGPDYRSPAPTAPAQAPFASARAPLFSGEQPEGAWWRLFNDPLLDRLVGEALVRNTDLRVADANLRRAQAALRETRSERLPSGGVSASASTNRQSDLGAPGGATRGEIFDGGLDVGYQLDLFGRVRRAVEASRADLGAVQAAYDLTRITVAAETTRAYADACSAGAQLLVAERSLALQQQTFDLSQRLLTGGRGTALETGQASQLLEQTRAQIPGLQAQRRTALFRLSVLTGRTPADFPPEVGRCTDPPVLGRAIPVGDGATLLRRRPDVRAAERRLAAATARIGVATAELYPDVSLGGSIGATATSLGGILSGGALRYSVGPLLSWAFLDRSRVRARIDQAEAGAQAALAEFDGTWLGALEEAESALTRYSASGEEVATLRRARAGGEDAARVARVRYQAGREGFQIVLEAERRLAEVEVQLTNAETRRSDALVTLFLALGGGWEGGVAPFSQAAATR